MHKLWSFNVKAYKRLLGTNFQCIWTHCIIHVEAFTVKGMNPGLNTVLTIVVTVADNIKLNPLKSRLFSAFCKDLDIERSTLFFIVK